MCDEGEEVYPTASHLQQRFRQEDVSRRPTSVRPLPLTVNEGGMFMTKVVYLFVGGTLRRWC